MENSACKLLTTYRSASYISSAGKISQCVSTSPDDLFIINHVPALYTHIIAKSIYEYLHNRSYFFITCQQFVIKFKLTISRHNL